MWPKIKDVETARKASRWGFWAALVAAGIWGLSGVGLLAGLHRPDTQGLFFLTPLAYFAFVVDLFILLAIAWGVRKRIKGAAIAGLLYCVISALGKLGSISMLFYGFLIFAFITSIRGIYAYHGFGGDEEARLALVKAKIMLSRYLVLSGLFLGIALALWLMLFDSPTMELSFGVASLLVVMLLAFPIYQSKLRPFIAKMSAVFLLLFSLVTNLFFASLVAWIIVNLPKGRPFDEKVVVEAPPEMEVAAFNRYYAPNSDYNWNSNCLTLPDNWKPFDYVHPSMAKILSSECQGKRDKLLDFHVENVMSKPLSKYKGEYIDDGNIPEVKHLRCLWQIELTDIAQRLQEGDLIPAQQKYIRLWKATENLLSPRLNTLIQTMIAIYQFKLLTSFYAEYGSRLQLEHNKELINTVQQAISKMDESMADSFRREYGFLKLTILKLVSGQNGSSHGFLQSTETKSETTDSEFGIRQIFGYIYLQGINFIMNHIANLPPKWPFFDTYETLKLFDDWHDEYIQLSKDPGYKKEAWHRFDRKLDQFTSSLWSSSKNFGGRTVAAVAVPNRTKGVFRKEVQKSHAIALVYMLSVTDPHDLGEIPIDNLTGKKFLVTFKDNTLEIKGKQVHYKARRSFH
jgi:hypothetical protein